MSILIQIKEKMVSMVSRKTFFKLVNNSIYGKTIKDLRQTMNVRLVNNAKDYKNGLVDKVLFHRMYLIKILFLFIKLNQI